EIGRVVRVDRDDEAFFDHLPQRMATNVVDHPEAHIRQRADGERNPLASEARHEPGIVERADAVVDTGDVEQVERLAHIAGGAFLAGMGNGLEPERAGPLEYPPELRRRLALL